MSVYFHKPVMVNEVLDSLKVAPGGVYIDATVGEGGHAEAIFKASQPGGQVLGIDRDSSMIRTTENRLKEFGKDFQAYSGNFIQLKQLADKAGLHNINGVLFDLGFSSRHLELPERGFSFRKDGPLDMRFDISQEVTADQVVNTWPERNLAEAIHLYGEEPKARKIARHIVRNRPIRSTIGLAKLIEQAVVGRKFRIHPATRTFQAIRIVVNQELDNVALALSASLDLLAFGGRLAVITYHSLEAKIVKGFLRRQAGHCICPPAMPICTCNPLCRMRQVTKKAIAPNKEEYLINRRCRTARLRVGERV